MLPQFHISLKNSKGPFTPTESRSDIFLGYICHLFFVAFARCEWTVILNTCKQWRIQGPISFIFMQFLAKACQIIGFLREIKGLPPPFQLENPGSTTGKTINATTKHYIGSRLQRVNRCERNYLCTSGFSM